MPYSHVTKLYELHDEARQLWFNHFVSPGLAGNAYVSVPREVQDVKTLRRHLLNRGADLTTSSDEVIAAAIATETHVVRRAACTGWRDGDALFVSHNHVSGDAGDITVIPPECKLTGHLEEEGDLPGWQNIARKGRYSTAMIVALCATFTAPLLKLLQRSGFILVFVGPSRVGKTTAQLLGASPLGFGREEDLWTLNATDAGLLAAGSAFNDHVLPINEAGAAAGAKADVYDEVRKLTYALTSGRDTLRHPVWSDANGGTSAGFRCLGTLSSELTPDQWAGRNGEIRDPGETARLISVPVLYDGEATIFDLRPERVTDAELPGWQAAKFAQIKQGLMEHRGVAFRAYTDAIVADLQAVIALAQERISRFERLVVKPGMSPVQLDIVSKCALLYAGGVIAIEKGILPFEKREVRDAVEKSCGAILAALPDPEAELRADLATLNAHLASGAMLDRDTFSARQLTMLRNADGYHGARENGREFVIRAQSFMNLFSSSPRTRRILEWLDEEGFLDHDRARGAGRSNEWAQKQVTWPDGTRVRSFKIYLPGGLDDLTRDG